MDQGLAVLKIDNQIRSLWRHLTEELSKMGGDVRPRSASDIFISTPDSSGVTVDVQPVSFFFKEKFKHLSKTLYITVSGKMNFSTLQDVKELRINTQGARVGYFRKISDKRIEHVLGAHYDYENIKIAHPVYHLQLSSKSDFVHDINRVYRTEFDDVRQVDDHMTAVLKNVRVPTAQIDVFGVFMQIISDHLVGETEDKAVEDAFMRLKGVMGRFKGDLRFASRLEKAVEMKCFRSNHWY